MLRERRWRDVLGLVDLLPADSHYRQALLEDPEVIASILDAEERRERASSFDGVEFSSEGEEVSSEWTPPPATYGVVEDVLAGIFDRLGILIQAAHGAAGARPPHMPAYPRPRTGLDVARRDRDIAWAHSFMERLQPGSTHLNR